MKRIIYSHTDLMSKHLMEILSIVTNRLHRLDAEIEVDYKASELIVNDEFFVFEPIRGTAESLAYNVYRDGALDFSVRGDRMDKVTSEIVRKIYQKFLDGDI